MLMNKYNKCRTTDATYYPLYGTDSLLGGHRLYFIRNQILAFYLVLHYHYLTWYLNWARKLIYSKIKYQMFTCPIQFQLFQGLIAIV